MATLRPAERHRSARRRGATTVELVTLFAVIGIVLSVAVGQFLPTQRQVLDKVGPVLLSASVLDARAVASANHYRYPGDPADIASALNDLTAANSTDSFDVTYTAGPAELNTDEDGKRSMAISVAPGSPVTVGLAALTSVSGPQDGTCVLAVDSLRTGTTYAQMTGVFVTSNECSGAVAAACAPSWADGPGAGTASDPYSIEREAACVTSTS